MNYNLQILLFRFLKGELLLSIDVCDDDGDVTPPKNDLVTSMHQNISLVATRFGAAPETQFVLSFGKQRMPGIFPKLTMQLRQVTFPILWCTYINAR